MFERPKISTPSWLSTKALLFLAIIGFSPVGGFAGPTVGLFYGAGSGDLDEAAAVKAATLAALADVNRSLPVSKQISLVMKDDTCDPIAARGAAREFLDNKVQFLISAPCSRGTSEQFTKTLLESRNTLLFIVGDKDPRLPGGQNLVFRTQPSFDSLQRAGTQAFGTVPETSNLWVVSRCRPDAKGELVALSGSMAGKPVPPETPIVCPTSGGIGSPNTTYTNLVGTLGKNTPTDLVIQTHTAMLALGTSIMRTDLPSPTSVAADLRSHQFITALGTIGFRKFGLINPSRITLKLPESMGTLSTKFPLNFKTSDPDNPEDPPENCKRKSCTKSRDCDNSTPQKCTRHEECIHEC